MSKLKFDMHSNMLCKVMDKSEIVLQFNLQVALTQQIDLHFDLLTQQIDLQVALTQHIDLHFDLHFDLQFVLV